MNTTHALARRCFLVAAMFLAVVVQAGSTRDHSPFSKLVVFGDSISDDGNLFTATGGAIPPAPYYVNGHFSNGPVWVEYLAEQLGLADDLENYAFGGACSGRESYVSFAYGIPGLPGLQDEIDLFAKASGGRADPHALYIVQAGANDIFLWTESGMPSSLAAFADQVASNLFEAVSRLKKMGARHILVVDVADLGLTPDAQASGYDELLSVVTQTVNTAVAAKFKTNKHCPGPAVGLFSLFDAMHAIVDDADLFGFSNVTYPYLTVLAGNPDVFLFWDGVHPTTMGHGELADFAYARLQQLYPQLRHRKQHAGCN
ncbi:MAG: SGNH/GDSL hydrolase family protein [Nibricoccus sp.]